MAFIDFVEWNPESNDIFAYRFPNKNLSTLTQLVVRESQEAILFSKGQLIGKFGPGKHTLSTENLPGLRNFYGIPFGGENPFVAEVWFVNKTAPLNIDWNTGTMRFMDPEYGQMIPLYSEGRYGLKVIDAEKFLVQLVGTLHRFTAKELTNHFMGALISKTKSSISAFMNANGVGLNYVSSHLDELSNFIGQPLAEFWETYGFHLEGFYITTIDLDTSTVEGQKISEALSDRSAQGIAGYTWQQKQTFNVANNATENGAGMSGLMAAAMLGGGLGGNVGNSLLKPSWEQGQASANNLGTKVNEKTNVPPQRHDIFCAKCGKKRLADVMYCGNCGKKYFPCPVCGSDNSEDAKRCVRCGTTLQTETSYGPSCPRCGTCVTEGTKFCPVCGHAINS